MDLLYPEKINAFESLVAESTPTESHPASELLFPPSSEIVRRFDTDIARLHELCRSLKTERNKHVPILHIPVEVLGNIVEICAYSEPPDPTHRSLSSKGRPGHTPHGWLGWVRLGHISQRFRRVILSMSALWANIAFSLPTGHAEILSRARSAPLTITLLRSRVSPDLISTAEARISAARIIRLDLSVPSAAQMFEQIVASDKKLVALEELDLSVAKVPRHVTMDLVDLPPLRAPHLRHLKLRNYFLPFTYPSLETLELRFQDNVFDRTSTAPPHFHGSALLDVLRRCTGLRRLHLGGMQLANLPGLSSSQTAVSLPRLKLLSMHGPATFCLSVWSMLVLQPCTRIKTFFIAHRVRFQDLPTVFVQEEAFVSMLVQHVRRTENQTVTGVRLDCRTQDVRLALAVNETGAFTTETEGPLAEGRVFVLDIHSRRRDRNDPPALFQQRLSYLATVPELSGIDTLALSPPQSNNIITSEWRSWLAPFDAVRNLICDEFPPQSSLWNALCPPAQPDDVAPILPNLHTLFLLPTELHDGFQVTAPEQLASWDDITAGLGRRTERGIGIGRVVLGALWDMAETVDSDNIAALRSVVPQVIDNRRRTDVYT